MENVIDDELLSEIGAFETFLQRIGFKRLEGSIFGLLVLSERALRSDEIEKTLGLSQSAVSIAIKQLSHYGAIETHVDASDKRTKLHTAKVDSLSIVATVFRKREQEAIEEFKAMAQRCLKKTGQRGGPRGQRLQSIISTCEIAEAVMNFVITMAQKGLHLEYPGITARLPKALELVLSTGEPLGRAASGLTHSLANRLKDGLEKFKGDLNA